MVEVTTLQSAVAYNASDLNGAAIETLNTPAMLVWFTPAGSYDGTATFYVSPDGGATYFAVDGRAASTIETPLNAVATPTATVLYIVPVPSGCLFRVVMSGGTQGSLSVFAARSHYSGIA